jgi:hypothetical protein
MFANSCAKALLTGPGLRANALGIRAGCIEVCTRPLSHYEGRVQCHELEADMYSVRLFPISVEALDRRDDSLLLVVGQVIVEWQAHQPIAHILSYRTRTLSVTVAQTHRREVQR